MSEDTTTQTVVDDTKTTAQPVVAADSARNDGDDLDALLAQFNQQTTLARTEPASPAPQPQTSQQQPTVDPNRLAAIENRLFQEDLNKAVANIMGDLKIPTRVAKGWIDQMANEDPRIQRAFAERHTNPQAWERVEKGLSREFAKEMKALTDIDPNATEDRAAVAAAVRGASTQRAPETPAPNYSQQSNAEYRRSVREQYGFDPGV